MSCARKHIQAKCCELTTAATSYLVLTDEVVDVFFFPTRVAECLHT